MNESKENLTLEMVQPGGERPRQRPAASLSAPVEGKRLSGREKFNAERIRRLESSGVDISSFPASQCGPVVIDGTGFRFVEFQQPKTYVSVSSVAREWGISSRRVRVMLAEGRLIGRQGENGYWEVMHPYQYTFGKRGPALKARQKQAERVRKNPARFKEQTLCAV